jgi:hypothetical protein
MTIAVDGRPSYLLTARIGGFENTTLIYLYNQTATDRGAIPDLRVKKLLLPPLATNAQAWRDGYFETVDNRLLFRGKFWGHPSGIKTMAEWNAIISSWSNTAGTTMGSPSLDPEVTYPLTGLEGP